MRHHFGFVADSEEEARKGFAEEYAGVPVVGVKQRAGRWTVRGMLTVHLADMVRLAGLAPGTVAERIMKHASDCACVECEAYLRGYEDAVDEKPSARVRGRCHKCNQTFRSDRVFLTGGGQATCYACAGVLRPGADAPAEPEIGLAVGTLAHLQATLPWGNSYAADFQANKQAHRDFAHAVIHIVKAAGHLAALIDELDHASEENEGRTSDAALRKLYAPKLADVVISALRAANTFPGGAVDLGKDVVDRLTRNVRTKGR